MHSTNSFPPQPHHQAIELAASPDGLPWAAEAACSDGLMIRRLVSSLLDLRATIGCLAPPVGEVIHAEVYWPSIYEGLQRVRTGCEAIFPVLETCKPWLRIVVKRLHREVESCIRSNQLDLSQKQGDWPPDPLHRDRREKLDRLFFALTYLPEIDLWRPVEAAKYRAMGKDLDELVARTVAKLFDEYRDDSDWLTWGTVETLLQDCERQLELRRDAGSFHSGLPSQVRIIRLLADRLGCDEAALEIEELDQGNALVRAITSPAGTAWSVATDNSVRDWLRRIIAWCSTWNHKVDGSASPGGTPEFKTKTQRKSTWTKETANLRAIELASRDPRFLASTSRDWAKAIGCSPALIASLPLWRHLQDWKKAHPDDRSVSAFTLSPKVMADVIGDGALKDLVKESNMDDEADEPMDLKRMRSSRSQRS